MSVDDDPRYVLSDSDLAAIEAEFGPCGSCDYGLLTACTCSISDPRPTMFRLIEAIKRLRKTRIDDGFHDVIDDDDPWYDVPPNPWYDVPPDDGLCHCGPMHNEHCEPPSELCCQNCSEVHHGFHNCEIAPQLSTGMNSHHDGSRCVEDREP